MREQLTRMQSSDRVDECRRRERFAAFVDVDGRKRLVTARRNVDVIRRQRAARADNWRWHEAGRWRRRLLFALCAFWTHRTQPYIFDLLFYYFVFVINIIVTF